MPVSAQVIADSVYEDPTEPGGLGPRLTTVQATGHRFILSELNTHGALARNSASSRAIPVSSQIERILSEPAFPEVWASEQRGMSGGAEIAYPGAADRVWAEAARSAVGRARRLQELNVHKSLINRVLEPFMWHTVVITATAWQNFFDQRCSPLAQPEIRAMAELIRDAIDASTPTVLQPGEWHTPYLEEETRAEIRERTADNPDEYWPVAVQVSAARVARTSYLTMDGKRSIAADLDLYHGTDDRVGLTSASPPHWSPLDQVATPWRSNRQGQSLPFTDHAGETQWAATDHLPRIGRFVGWRTLRTEVETARAEVTYR